MVPTSLYMVSKHIMRNRIKRHSKRIKLMLKVKRWHRIWTGIEGLMSGALYRTGGLEVVTHWIYGGSDNADELMITVEISSSAIEIRTVNMLDDKIVCRLLFHACYVISILNLKYYKPIVKIKIHVYTRMMCISRYQLQAQVNAGQLHLLDS